VSTHADAAASNRKPPFLVAHRAGNRPDTLREASRHRGVAVEADVRLVRDRLEVRHLKRAGPLPILWDRWELAPGWRPRATISDVFGQTDRETALIFDLKGSHPRVAELLRDEIALELELGPRQITVCARSWSLLDAFDELPVARIASVGSARQLTAFLQRRSGATVDGVSIHERLLDLAAVRRLRDVCDVIMTWPVNTSERAIELLRLGVDGLISDEPERILPVLRPRAA
jgi:glycerophosphoryl diester phosphodiesterase